MRLTLRAVAASARTGDMARWLVVLVLTFGVGLGFVGTGLEADCVTDDCRGDEHGDENDVGMDDTGGDECPPFCGGCARVPVQAAARIALVHLKLRGEPVVPAVPDAPLSAPPGNGLFRPPRA
jgi:hypothetical protein